MSSTPDGIRMNFLGKIRSYYSEYKYVMVIFGKRSDQNGILYDRIIVQLVWL